MTRATYRCAAAYVLSVVWLVVMAAPGFAQAPVAEAPAFQVGDEWRYTDESIVRVVAVEEGLTVTAVSPDRNCPDCRYYRDSNLTLVKVLNKEGKPEYDAAVGYKFLDFPLEIGKHWTSNQKLKSTSTGRYMNYENTFKVEGYEEVRTKAGTFKAFKISHSQRNLDYPWLGYLTFWYSPEVRRMVKREVRTGQWLRDLELVSYVLK